MASPRWFREAITRMPRKEAPLKLSIADDQSGDADSVVIGDVGQVIEAANRTKVAIRLNVKTLDGGKQPVSDDTYHIVAPGQKVMLGVEANRRLRVEVPLPLMGGRVGLAYN